ncbi:MAG: hypothetical protein ACYDCO_15970 [Armatimonadota bacterium]
MLNATSPLSLDACRLVTLSITTREIDNPVTPCPGAQLSINFTVRQHNEHPSKYMIPATFTFAWDKNSRSVYQAIEITLNGFFSIKDGVPDELVKQCVPVLCVANLYSTARGIVAQATGMCEGGPYLIPVIDLHSLLEHVEEESPTPKRRRTSSRRRGPKTDA